MTQYAHFYFLRTIYWISCLFFVLIPLDSIAATPVSLHRVSFQQLQQMTEIAFPHEALISTHHTPNRLEFMGQHVDHKQITHLRMQQTYLGFPVLGGYAIVHRSHKKVLSLNGTLYRGLEKDLGQPPAEFKSKGQSVLTKFMEPYQDKLLSEQEIIPMVYIDEQHHATWAYKVSVLVQSMSEAPSRPTAMIDAITGVVLKSWNELKTIRTSVKGQGFGGNQHTGRYQFGENMPFLQMLRDDFSGRCYLENKQVKVVDMNASYAHIKLPMEFDCPSMNKNDEYWTGYNEDGYDVRNGAYSPSNDALYIGGVIKQMYRQEYDVEALGIPSHPKQLIMRVHYGLHYPNAFWDGVQMSFGDGDDSFYPLVSLGIGAHEVSHGFTQQYSNLIYDGESGGINESFSDMAAQAVEYYAKGQSSWLIGAEILKKSTPLSALRFMDKPSRDGASIDSADQYEKDIDVHHASGVFNRLFYLLANQPNWDPRKAFRVMIKANMDYWIPTSTFKDGACGVLYATEDLEYAVDDVKRALDQVRIEYDDC